MNYCTCRYPDSLCPYCEREERHQDVLETRAFQIRDVLLERGHSSRFANKVGERFARFEHYKAVRWD
jgi:hypothetical protein